MMRPSSYATLRLLAVLLTVVVIAVHQYLPPKIVQLYPDPSRFAWIYGPERQGIPAQQWIDLERAHFRCNFAPGDPFACGWSANLGHDRTNGLNLSKFKGFNVVMHYAGNSPRLRVNIRNFDPAYSDINRSDLTSKVMATTIRTSDLNKPIYLSLSEFSVAEWWINENDIPREHSAPSLDNVIIFGVEIITHSDNEVRVERIEVIGDWLKKEALYMGIIFSWMTLIVLEVLSRFYLIHKKSQADALRISRLATEYQKLELEKREFEELSTTDTLTGIMNRAGVNQFLQRLFEDESEGSQVGVLLFDIDHFKNINDEFGHDVGDLVLSKMARIINQNIRQTDIFGRWGGEEFIVLCPKIPADNLRQFADKLRESVEHHPFEAPGHALKITVSIGATIFNTKEGFQSAFKRADIALYQAKNCGRNRVHFEQA